MLLGELGARDHRGDLLLLDHLPLDELLDIGMIDIDDHHLRRAARGAARLDRARRAVADLQEAHQARRFAAARELLVLAAQGGEVRAGAGAVFEQARLARPQIHDPAFVDEVVLDALDEAGVRLRMFIGRRRLRQPSRCMIDVIVPLTRAIDAVGPVQAGVEPLRAVGRRFLRRQHVAHLVVEGARIGFAVEVMAFPAPIGPCAGHAVEDLLGGVLADALIAVSLVAPQPFRHAFLGDRLELRGDAGLAEILLRQNVGRDLAPRRGDFHIRLAEHNRTVWVSDLARSVAEFDAFIGGAALGSELTTNTHCYLPRRSLVLGPSAFFSPHRFGDSSPVAGGAFARGRPRTAGSGASQILCRGERQGPSMDMGWGGLQVKSGKRNLTHYMLEPLAHAKIGFTMRQSSG